MFFVILIQLGDCVSSTSEIEGLDGDDVVAVSSLARTCILIIHLSIGGHEKLFQSVMISVRSFFPRNGVLQYSKIFNVTNICMHFAAF